MIQGRSVTIKDASGAVIAASKSCDIEYSCETIETASISSGKARNFIAGRTSWSISLSWLVMNVSSSMLKVGQTIQIQIANAQDDTDYLIGTAICTKCKITANVGALAQGSFVFQGTGDLS